MKALLCNTAIAPMIDLLRRKKEQQITREEIVTILNHEDYQFEFQRYEERVSQDEFAEYLMTFENLEESQISNNDLRNHHAYWLDLYVNLDWYEKKSAAFF